MLTKQDVYEIGLIVDDRLDIKLAPLKADLEYIKNTLRSVIDKEKEDSLDHEQRITRLEDKVFPQ